VIRDVVIHLLSEQPVLADLFEVPAPGDANLVCTNPRTLAGKRPVFIDHVASTFVFPYRHIRFIEIRPEQQAASEADALAGKAPAKADPAPDEGDLEIDEDFLRRIREA
jgi:hypothetical protein